MRMHGKFLGEKIDNLELYEQVIPECFECLVSIKQQQFFIYTQSTGFFLLGIPIVTKPLTCGGCC